MTSNSLLTYGAKLINVQSVYFAPIVQIPPTYHNLSTLYCLLSRVDGWVNDTAPPAPTQDQKYIKGFLKNVFAAKQITSNQISPVVRRIDWSEGQVYDYYADDYDVLKKDSNGDPYYQFYVVNRYNQVFKCLWNNNGGPSLYEPFFQPGNYNTNGIYQNIDGYKWHYMYTIDDSLRIRFMDSVWIPVPIKNTTLDPVNAPTGEGYGGIEVLNVIDGGSGYNPANSLISLVITGDGTGANGSIVYNNGSISDILITNPGQNYTYANAYIQTANGSGAIIAANTVSPIGGHGYDPISELGCNHVMFSIEFDGSEGGNIPTDITYHQVGIMANPVADSSVPLFANSSIYKTSTSLIVAGGFGAYVRDELVYQGTSVTDNTFIGTVLDFNTSTNELTLINTTGSLITNVPVFGNSSGTARTLLTYTPPDFQTLSGYLVYMENRSAIQRSTDGIEQFKVVLTY